MAQKPIDQDTLDVMWRAYCQKQSVAYVVRKCREVGIDVSQGTIKNYIHRGNPNRGIVSLSERHAGLGLGPAVTTPEAKAVAVATARGVVAGIQAGAAFEAWRQVINNTMGGVGALHGLVLKEIKKKLEGDKESLDPKELKTLSSTLKDLMQTIKIAGESHDVFNALDNTDTDGRDDWMRQTFKGWTKEEYLLFRDEGEWPERFPTPDFLDQTAAGLEEDPRDDAIDTFAEELLETAEDE